MGMRMGMEWLGSVSLRSDVSQMFGFIMWQQLCPSQSVGEQMRPFPGRERGGDAGLEGIRSCCSP